MNENYQVVFDASQRGFPWLELLAPLVGLAIISAGIYWVKNREKLPKFWREIGLLLAGFLIVFGVCFTFAIIAMTLSAHTQATQTLQDGTASIVEGQVVGLTTTAGGNAESIMVSGIQFAYSEYSDSVGFHHTSTHGGPMRDGLYVRIHYIHINGDPSEPTILKLEIKR